MKRLASFLLVGLLVGGPPAPAAPLEPPARDALAAGFATPPPDTRPRTFWFWMNGNVTRDGITRDLEAMARVGIGGVIIYDGGTYLPAGSAGYLGPEWRSLMTHAIQEGNRLGIEVGLHNSPGWSSSGGPWVQPAQAMQQLVASETTVQGGRHVELTLSRPQENLGFYRDAKLVAFPALAGETTRYEDALARVTTGARLVAKAVLSDGALATGVAVSPDEPLLIEFNDAVELHALKIQASPRARFPKLKVEASLDGKDFTAVCAVSSPGRHGIAAPAVRNFPAVRARFVRLTPATAGDLAEVVLHRTPRLLDWVAKANFDYRVTGQLAPPVDVPAEAAIDPRTVLDLTPQLQGDRLEWDAPPGAWTILRIGHTPTGQENIAASAAGRGLEIDKFNPAATEFHFQRVIDQVRADAEATGAKGPDWVTIDSYEAGMQNWTEEFPAEFQCRAGYDLTGYLPALFGRVVGDAGVAERFLYDFRRVQAELMAQNYFERMGALARDRKLTFAVEGYGPGNFDELRVAGISDVPMAEFWSRTPWTPNRVVKMVTSAAHVYGKPVVAAESFTGEAQTSRWLDYPYALKALGDEMFAQGLNEIVFHRYAHQPHPDAVPGMAMGPYGFNFERTNTWFAQSRTWLAYLQRCHFLLRQGTYSADVLYFTGERSPDASQYAQPVLPPGYNYDLVNADVLLHRVTVRDGAYVLPEGGRYRLLVLPPDLKAMSPAVVRRLEAFVAQGAALLGPKPIFSPTLTGYPASEAEMKRAADALWGTKPAAGGGRVLSGISIADVLRDLGVAPDLSFAGASPDAALAWQHRRLAEGDLFFLANRQRRSEELTVSFRGMAGREPEIWQPETGARAAVALYKQVGDRVELPLRFEAAEALFVLFRHAATKPSVGALTRNGVPILPAGAPPRAADATRNFTMAIWVKPDTDLREFPTESTAGRIDEVGKFYAIPADPGDVRFGAGHATAGLAVGRNGVFVVERAMETCPAVLVAKVPISGWTHVAVVYREGQPSLYVNGRFVRSGLVSGKVVHSGVGSPPPPVDYVLNFPGIAALTRAAGQPPPPSRGAVYFFEGNSTTAGTIDRALSEREIAELARAGVPPPEVPIVTDVTRTPDGVGALVWQSGEYALASGKPVQVEVPPTRELAGPWQVSFQAHRGAPASVVLPELKSLHLHKDPAVKYFAGTASYARALDVPAEFIGSDRRIVLDLGRVEVMAEVSLNGRIVGSLWKEPYRVDVTDAVHAGNNQLEIRVTTLWTNRLIGDEQLPAEDEFGLRNEQGADPHGIVKLPAWYLEGKPKPDGGRVTFSTWRFYDRTEPLVAAGLLGPVRLLNPQRVQFGGTSSRE